MKFEEFKKNVEGWAEVRGIYAESTVEDQMELGLREFGEVITAKDGNEWLMEVGDCIVLNINCAKMDGYDIHTKYLSDYGSGELSWAAYYFMEGCYLESILALRGVVSNTDQCIEECFDLTWDKIKDRKGMMINKKYVKWDNLNEEQRAEFTKREEERK